MSGGGGGGYQFRFAEMDSPKIEDTAASSNGVFTIQNVGGGGSVDGGIIGGHDIGNGRLGGGGDGSGGVGNDGGSGVSGGSEEGEADSGEKKLSSSGSSYQLITPEVLARLSADAYGTQAQNDASTKIVSYNLKPTRKKKY